MDIVNYRLANQHLISSVFENSQEVVSHFGAVQAQDYNAAKWSIGLRLKNSRDKEIEQAFNEGKILRTHILRPTWHFVSPENLNWIEKLTSDRVKQLMKTYNIKLELTDELFKKTNKLICKTLQSKNYLTRQEIKSLLDEINIKTNVQRLAHIVMWAELDGLICSGPMRNKSFTYALLSERAPKQKNLTREESLAELVKLYYQSHGPSLIKDFSWWSGLSMKDATQGASLNKSKLFTEKVNGKQFWFFPTKHNPLPAKHSVFLLSVYDEYFIGYKDRSFILENNYKKNMVAVGNALLTSLIIINGRVEGTWKKKLGKDKIEIKLNLFRKLNHKEMNELKIISEKYGNFLGMSVILL